MCPPEAGGQRFSREALTPSKAPVLGVLGVAVDHLPDKEKRKWKTKKTFKIDFSEDVNFDTYFRTTRVRTFFIVIPANMHPTWWIIKELMF